MLYRGWRLGLRTEVHVETYLTQFFSNFSKVLLLKVNELPFPPHTLHTSYIWRHADNLIEATANYYTFFFIYNAYTLRVHGDRTANQQWK